MADSHFESGVCPAILSSCAFHTQPGRESRAQRLGLHELPDHRHQSRPRAIWHWKLQNEIRSSARSKCKRNGRRALTSCTRAIICCIDQVELVELLYEYQIAARTDDTKVY